MTTVLRNGSSSLSVPGRARATAMPSNVQVPASGTSITRSIPALSSESRCRPGSQSGAIRVVMHARVSGCAEST